MTNIKWVWTIPNILSLVRIAMIPAMVLSYFLLPEQIWVSALLLVLSGVTDSLDGIIARRLNQISDIGKLLDPIADKLTQVTVIVCLAITYPDLWALVGIAVVKELLQAIGGLVLLRSNVKVAGSKWFGKVATFLFYIIMLLLVIFPEMVDWLRLLLIALVAAFMLIAFFGYLREFIRLWQTRPEAELSPDEGEKSA